MSAPPPRGLRLRALLDFQLDRALGSRSGPLAVGCRSGPLAVVVDRGPLAVVGGPWPLAVGLSIGRWRWLSIGGRWRSAHGRGRWRWVVGPGRWRSLTVGPLAVGCRSPGSRPPRADRVAASATSGPRSVEPVVGASLAAPSFDPFDRSIPAGHWAPSPWGPVPGPAFAGGARAAHSPEPPHSPPPSTTTWLATAPCASRGAPLGGHDRAARPGVPRRARTRRVPGGSPGRRHPRVLRLGPCLSSLSRSSAPGPFEADPAASAAVEGVVSPRSRRR
jgi:hypothetical protein